MDFAIDQEWVDLTRLGYSGYAATKVYADNRGGWECQVREVGSSFVWARIWADTISGLYTAMTQQIDSWEDSEHRRLARKAA